MWMWSGKSGDTESSVDVDYRWVDIHGSKNEFNFFKLFTVTLKHAFFILTIIDLHYW